jgi:hypothetical protein
MTHSERNSAIKSLIKDHTARVTVSKEAARASLIASGIYTKSGELHPSLGGPSGKARAKG